MTRSPLLVVALAMAVAPRNAVAQARDWTAYRDSLRSVTDVPALQRLQGRLPMPGVATTPDPVLERGLITLRVWEITQDRVDADLARDVFEAGVDRFGGIAWMHYGLALAQAARHRSSQDSPGGITIGSSVAEILRKDPATRARRAAEEAIEIDPSLTGAAVLIADLAVADGRDRDALLDARTALESVRAAGHGTPEISRALADVQTALGNYGEAALAVESIGGSVASSLRSRAIALLLQPGHETEGARAYFSAVDSLDEPAADRFFDDVEPIANPAEIADWDAADGVTTRRMWIERFWSRRAAESGTTESQRLAAHYQRLALARRDYLRNSRRGVNGPGVLLSESRVENSPFDDRGLVLLKLGLPLTVVRSRGDGLLLNETWVYPGPEGGNQLFHFVALRGSRDFSLVRDLLEAMDPTLDPIGNKSRFDRAVIALISDRAPFEPRYQAIAAQLPVELATLRNARIADGGGVRSMLRTMVSDVDADYRREARNSLSGDTFVAGFERPLPFHYDLFTFRAPYGRTDLTAAFAARAADLAAIEEGDHVLYPIGISVILMDTLTDEVTRKDTTIEIRPDHTLGPDEFVRAYATLPVVPSEHTVYRVVARSTPIGAGTLEAGATRLKDYTGSGLQISDLVLATPDSRGGWSRGDLTLDVTLPRQFQPDHPFTLFYEVYNLKADDPYRTHLRVESASRGGLFGGIKRLLGFDGPGIELRFENRARLAADESTRELRDLGSDLPPGRYRMTITVTNDRTGEQASSETVFEVVR